MSEVRIHPDAPPLSAARLKFVTALACAWLALPSARAAEPVPPVPAQPAPVAPFEHYQAWREAPVRDWREVNDRVGEVGGWRTYLRESQDDAGQDHHGQHGQH